MFDLHFSVANAVSDGYDTVFEVTSFPNADTCGRISEERIILVVPVQHVPGARQGVALKILR